MSGKKIDQSEIDKYWEIFATLLPPGALSNSSQHYLNGDQASSILKNSGLGENKLERVWDLADVDNDGRLDFVEFCVAMRLVFDLVNGEIADVPQQLPDWLVPESKAHLVQAGRAMTGGGEQFERPQDDDDDEDGVRLKDGFDWYMAPAQKSDYEDIYTSARDGHGYVGFHALENLYQSLDVPDTDVRSAWNLVNPAADEVIGKDACMAYLHLLRGRHDGYRLPRTVPPSLRASFEKRDIDYNLERARTASTRTRQDDNTATGKKSKFGDGYLSRLARGSDSRSAPKGTDFGGQTTADWEEVRLKKQLKELETKIDQVEAAANRRGAAERRSDSKPALVKRELEQLLDYKRRELLELESGSGDDANASGGLQGIAEEIATVKEQVDGLQAHLRKREEVLEDLRRQIAEEKQR